MVAKMTYGKKMWEHLDTRMRALIPVLHNTMKDFIPAIDADTEAFNQYMICMKLPQKSEVEKAARLAAMESALQEAVMVPLRLARNVDKLWEVMVEVAHIGNINCKSDLQVGVRCLETGVWGAYYNVIINLKDLKDEDIRNKVKTDAEKELATATTNCASILQQLDERLE